VCHGIGGYEGRANVNFSFRVCRVTVVCLLLMVTDDTENIVIKIVHPNKVLQEHETIAITLNRIIRWTRDLLIIKSLIIIHYRFSIVTSGWWPSPDLTYFGDDCTASAVPRRYIGGSKWTVQTSAWRLAAQRRNNTANVKYHQTEENVSIWERKVLHYVSVYARRMPFSIKSLDTATVVVFGSVIILSR
jgi:hypothetical protein